MEQATFGDEPLPKIRRPSRKPSKLDLSGSNFHSKAKKDEKKARSYSIDLSSSIVNFKPKKDQTTRSRSKSMDVSSKNPISKFIVAPKDEVMQELLPARFKKRENLKPGHELPRNSVPGVPADLRLDSNSQIAPAVPRRVYPEFNLLKSSILIKVNPAGSRIFTGHQSTKEEISSARGEISNPEAAKLGSPNKITTILVGNPVGEVLFETPNVEFKATANEVIPALNSGENSESEESNSSDHSLPELETDPNNDFVPRSSGKDILAGNGQSKSSQVSADAHEDSQENASSTLPGKDDVVSEEVLPVPVQIESEVPNVVSIKILEPDLDTTSQVKTGQLLITAGVSPGRKSVQIKSVYISHQLRLSPDLDIKAIIQNEFPSLENVQEISTVKGPETISASSVLIKIKEQSPISSPMVICSGYSSAGLPCAGGPCAGEPSTPFFKETTSSPEVVTSLREVESGKARNMDDDSTSPNFLVSVSMENQFEPASKEKKIPRAAKNSVSTMTCLQYRKSRINIGQRLDSQVQGFMTSGTRRAWMHLSELSPLYQLLLHHGSMVVWRPVCPLAQHIRWERGCTVSKG